MWDLRTFTALNKFTDDGSLSTTGLALSPHYLATGSSSGVVNIYSLSALRFITMIMTFMISLTICKHLFPKVFF